MKSLSQVSSSGLQNQGQFSRAGMASREVAVNSYESLDAGLTIKTREGDVVTLSSSRFSEINAREYSREGEITSQNGQSLSKYNLREITLTTGEMFSFSVEGDLSEAELADIESIVAGVDSIIGEMATGDMDDAISKAMAMGSYDSVSSYEADISVARSYEMSAQTQYSAYTRDQEEILAPAFETALADSGSSFMDKVAQLLETQEKEALAMARQPLGSLFDHYLESPALNRPEKDLEKDLEKDMVFKGNDVYSMLEQAGKTIDQMINNMVKGLFENTLSQVA